MPQLDFSYYLTQFGWSIFGFSFLYFVSSKYIIKYINNIVNSRANLINGNLEFSKELLKKADLIQKKIQMKEEETKKTIDLIHTTLHNQISEMKNEKLINLKNFINTEIEKSNKMINIYFQANEQDIKRELYSIVDRIVELMEIENRKEAIEYISSKVNNNIDCQTLNLFR